MGWKTIFKSCRSLGFNIKILQKGTGLYDIRLAQWPGMAQKRCALKRHQAYSSRKVHNFIVAMAAIHECWFQLVDNLFGSQ